MSKKTVNKKNTHPGFIFKKKIKDFEEYELKSNGLKVIYHYIPGTEVVTTNMVYLVGSRDEERGETGLAHMLEHMLFKPTVYDRQRKNKVGAAMDFERNVGCILNANTWCDRTSYFFNFPKQYFERVLTIEMERMVGTIITDKTLEPEKNNVLSEFDMYNGDPHFALDMQMVSSAFVSHPYGHETIGFREDIEEYTADKLKKFYNQYYRPDNAVLLIIGDVEKKEALTTVKKVFSGVKKPTVPIIRKKIREPKSEGVKKITVERPSNTNLLFIGFYEPPFPGRDWFISKLMLDILTDGEDSILSKLLIDTNLASEVTGQAVPFSEPHLNHVSITLAPDIKHEDIEDKVLNEIWRLKQKDISALLNKAKIQSITEEQMIRLKSLDISRELTEYVAGNNWSEFLKTTDLISDIKSSEVINFISEVWQTKKMVIGYFKGSLNKSK